MPARRALAPLGRPGCPDRLDSLAIRISVKHRQQSQASRQLYNENRIADRPPILPLVEGVVPDGSIQHFEPDPRPARTDRSDNRQWNAMGTRDLAEWLINAVWQPRVGFLADGRP